MIEIKRILCPTDFSEFAQHALKQAVALARWYESAITALHVFEVPVTLPAIAPDGTVIALNRRALSPDYRRELEADLGRFVAPAAVSGVTVHQAVVEGDIIDVILKQAHALPADLIVMGTHGRSGFERLLLGSATEHVLRKAPCPVLTVPRRAAGTTSDFKRILCPIDFSESSKRALAYALSLAQEADARLVVAHVIELMPVDEMRADRLHDEPAYREVFGGPSRDLLTAAIPTAARSSCAIEEVIVVGKAYKEILRLADAHNVDLIVIGVHGRGVADLMLFGSTTQHVVRQATCPVLTLRHPSR